MKCGQKPTIVLLTGSSLCHNPRAVKEASALARAGYRVCVLGAWADPDFKARDQLLIEDLPFAFIPVFDLTAPGLHNAISRFGWRAGKRAADTWYDLTGWQSSRQLGFATERMFRHALSMSADLYLAHSEPCLYVAARLLRCGRRVGVDMEDWFSEDLLPEARRHRPLRLLRELEGELLSRGAYASCPSQAMSAALAAEYACPPPTAVYNAFAWSDRQALDGTAADRRNRKIPSVYWFSTTLGPGRGLDDLLAALPLLRHDVEIHLRGDPAPGFEQSVRARVPEGWRERIYIHPLVTNDQLLPRIAEHDIGFAGETTQCRSRDLTVTNKILHYLLGGLAIVASDTSGQREVARQALAAVHLYPSGDARALAERLDALLASSEALARAKAVALAAAQRVFCWERQERVLIEAVGRALEDTARMSLSSPGLSAAGRPA
jgi:glycosyltransferase involved in cell wall biosynthesis